LAYLAVRGNSGGPLFLCQDGWPLSHAILTAQIREILAGAGAWAISPATVFALVQPPGSS